jgi:RNase adapter protein RapZ
VKNIQITVITGMSGSGKSTAIAAFEDVGFYCVDNMPVDLLPKFLEMPVESNPEYAGLAFVMDLREKGFLSKYPPVFKAIKENGYRFNVLFLEADEDILINRYSETRRQHPLIHGKSLTQAIRSEKELLANLKNESDSVINTSNYNVHQLKSKILDIARRSRNCASMRINVLSFGYKNGIPLNSDLIIDVRFLINPYFNPDLKELTGEDKSVRDFVLADGTTRPFLVKYFDLLDFLIPLYEREGKANLTIGVGCTGGQHRSVAIAGEIREHIQRKGKEVILTHRDIRRSSTPNSSASGMF